MRVFDQEKLSRLENYIHDYAFRNNGDVPRLPEIMEFMEMSKATAYRYLVRLNGDGKIEYNGKGTLGLKEKKNSTRKYRSIRVPIYGSIICGSPAEEEQYNDGYLALPEEWVNGECFLLRARGDSMIDIGINEGDLVLVKRTENAEDGDIVVALTDDGNTLKRLRYENGQPVLCAENKTYPDSRKYIHPHAMTIQGVALKVIRDIK